ncbi:MAG: hypothetical protein Q8L92_17040, partial [Rubrivivax sp.]|nr:hypothetical protein [Rubrivivax sp.]
MSDPSSAEFAAPAHPPAGERGHAGVRWAMYLAFAAIAALSLLQAWYAHHYERIRAADAEIIHMAGLQRSFVQEIDRLAALLGRQGPVDPAHGQALAQVLDGSRADALLVEA